GGGGRVGCRRRRAGRRPRRHGEDAPARGGGGRCPPPGRVGSGLGGGRGRPLLAPARGEARAGAAGPLGRPRRGPGGVLAWGGARVDEPLVVILDDLHASDGDSIRLAAFVARSVMDVPVALLMGARPSSELASIARQAEVVRLTPLPDADMARLLATEHADRE